MLVPIAQIAVVNRQRKEMDLDHINGLAQSIQANGLLHPPVVRRPHEGEDLKGLPYALVVGGCRLAAYIVLGRDEIEVSLKEELSPLAAEICELDENLKRKNITWAEEVAAKARIHAIRLIENPFQTLEQTANEIGETKATMSRDLALAKQIAVDPSLKGMSSKSAASRSVSFAENIATKLLATDSASLSSIRDRLFIGDALDFAKTLPDHSVDLVLTDLPYAIDQFEVQSTGADHEGRSKFDDSRESVLPFIERLIPEITRITKPSGWICLFMSYEWHGWLMEQLTKAGRTPELPAWIWHRPGHGNYGHWPDRHAANRYEMIVVANGGDAKFVKKPLENVLSFEALSGADKIHNHQKPHALCRELIERFTVTGELVVDFCFGSGAILAAAEELGRAWKGSELNEANLAPAMSHIQQYTKVRK